MGASLYFAILVLRCALAFFRSRNQQAIVELALRQQLVTYAQKQSKPNMLPILAVYAREDVPEKPAASRPATVPRLPERPGLDGR